MKIMMWTRLLVTTHWRTESSTLLCRIIWCFGCLEANEHYQVPAHVEVDREYEELLIASNCYKMPQKITTVYLRPGIENEGLAQRHPFDSIKWDWDVTSRKLTEKICKLVSCSTCLLTLQGFCPLQKFDRCEMGWCLQQARRPWCSRQQGAGGQTQEMQGLTTGFISGTLRDSFWTSS